MWSVSDQLFILFLLCAVSSFGQQAEVRTAGAMMSIMHQNEIGPKIELKELEGDHIYALGARAQLKGEILIWDGVPYVSMVRDGRLVVDKDYDHEACLLVYSRVDRWNTYPVPDSVHNMKDLQTFLSEMATQEGLEEPFPFRIEGPADRVQWHVIDWPEGDTEHTHARHKSSGLHGSIEHEPVDILGFYSTRHHGVFTHHNSNLHMHVKTADGKTAGHVDDLALSGDMELFLIRRD